MQHHPQLPESRCKVRQIPIGCSNSSAKRAEGVGCLCRKRLFFLLPEVTILSTKGYDSYFPRYIWSAPHSH